MSVIGQRKIQINGRKEDDEGSSNNNEIESDWCIGNPFNDVWGGVFMYGGCIKDVWWWIYFVDLGELPADKKEGKDTINYTKQWTQAADAELRLIVKRTPVLYLDEIATLLKDSGNV